MTVSRNPLAATAIAVFLLMASGATASADWTTAITRQAIKQAQKRAVDEAAKEPQREQQTSSSTTDEEDIYALEGHPAWEIGRFAGWADGCQMKYGRPNNISYNAGMFINPRVKHIIANAARLDKDIFKKGYKVGTYISYYCVRNRSEFLWSDGLNDNYQIVKAFKGIQPALQSFEKY